MNRTFHPTRSTVRRAGLAVLAAGGVLGLLLAVDPLSVARAMRRFDGGALFPLLLLGVAYYALQGIRWHLLLRQVGARTRVVDSMLVNLAGQAVSAVLPLGDLTRAMMMTNRSGIALGRTAATVTIQELTFTVLVVAIAAPGLGRLPGGPMLMLMVGVGIAAVVAMLMVERVYARVRGVVYSAPGLRRFAADIDALQREVRGLLGRPAVLVGTVLDLGRVLIAVAALMVLLRGLHVDAVGWWDACLVLAISFVGGALSMLPGGIGANEAGVVGILMFLGVNPVAAAAVAVLQRVWLAALPVVGGGAAYVWLRGRKSREERPHRGEATALTRLAPAA